LLDLYKRLILITGESPAIGGRSSIESDRMFDIQEYYNEGRVRKNGDRIFSIEEVEVI
jgi:hypothetical protein